MSKQESPTVIHKDDYIYAFYGDGSIIRIRHEKIVEEIKTDSFGTRETSSRELTHIDVIHDGGGFNAKIQGIRLRN